MSNHISIYIHTHSNNFKTDPDRIITIPIFSIIAGFQFSHSPCGWLLAGLVMGSWPCAAIFNRFNVDEKLKMIALNRKSF